MFDKLKALFVKPHFEAKSESENSEPKVVLNNLDVFKTPEGFGRWTLVLGAEGCGKTTLVKEIAKQHKTFAYMSFKNVKTFQTVKNVDLYVIDDIHLAEPEQLEKVFQYLCGARHDNVKHVIAVSQDLKGIPSEVLRRFKVIAFFWSAKQHMKLQTVVFGGLKDARDFADRIIRLLPFQYILYDVQTGYMSEPMLNTNTELILKAMNEPMLNNNKTVAKKPKNTVVLENGEKISRENVKITPLIVKMLKEHPEYKYTYIAEQLGTTVHYVKKVASRYQRGLIKYAF